MTARSPSNSSTRATSRSEPSGAALVGVSIQDDGPKNGRCAMSKHCIAIGLAALLNWTGHCAAQTADPGPVRVGDRWSYDIKDDLTGDLRHALTVVVVEVNDKEITARATVRGKDRPLTMVFDLDWGRI